MTRLLLTVSPQAEREALSAARWYEAKGAGLGAAFLELVEHTLDAISENPFRFAALRGDVRRAQLRRFPYGVFFRVKSDRIRVIAILHLVRDPARWQKRR